MKKLFNVYSEKCDYDQFEEIILIADDENEAIEIGKKFFEDNQGEIIAKEIELNETNVVSTSFRWIEK